MSDEDKAEAGTLNSPQDVIKPLEEAPAATQLFWLLIWMFK